MLRTIKRSLLFVICILPLLVGVGRAQRPAVPKQPPPATEAYRSHDYRTQEKRDELSKKLMQRKNELRNQERENKKVHARPAAKEKPPTNN